MIYMDNAATTMTKPDEVIEAVVYAMRKFGNAGRGVTEASLDAARMIYDTREKLADFFHAENPARIAFTMNSTQSLNTAIRGLFCSKDHVITTVLEHNSVLRPLYACEEEGMELSLVECDERGKISYEEMEGLIKENTKAIVCTHGSNVTGNLLDLYRIGDIAEKHGILFVVDASQTAGVIPIDVQKMKIDVLCFTGHKSLLGPQGTGGIYVKEGVTIKPFLYGGSGIDSFNRHHPEEMPVALEAGTLNGHGIAGLGAAVSYLQKTGIDVIREKELELMWQFYEGIKEIPKIKVYGDFSTKSRCPIVSFNIDDIDSSRISDELSFKYEIATRAGAHCAPRLHEALGTMKQGAVRFSFSHYNTKEEVDEAINAVKQIAEGYRK